MLRRDFIKSSAILPILGMGLPLEAFAKKYKQRNRIKSRILLRLHPLRIRKKRTKTCKMPWNTRQYWQSYNAQLPC